MQLPTRKHTRLSDYDYGQNGAYFVTVCTKERACILSRIVGPDALIGPQMELTEIGKIVDSVIQNTNDIYDNVTIEKYIIMPNHVHILISFIDMENGPMGASGPTLGMVIRAIKTLATKNIGQPIWQDKFYDHVIRNEKDFLDHYQYIENNPAKWAEDEYFIAG